MIDKTVNYLQDIELLKKIEPIAERMELGADAVLNDDDLITNVEIEHGVDINGDKTKGFIAHFLTGLEDYRVNEHDQELVFSGSWICNPEHKTYTSSSLELLLPEWCFDYNFPASQLGHRLFKEIGKKVDNLVTLLRQNSGKQKVENLARLIILLDEQNLLG